MRYIACDMAGKTSSSRSDLRKTSVACRSTGADRQALGLPVKICSALSCRTLISSTALSRPRPVRRCMPIRRFSATQLFCATRLRDAVYRLHAFSVGPYDNNVYLLSDEKRKEALLIDAANDAPRILK